jgi:hypothetical protein
MRKMGVWGAPQVLRAWWGVGMSALFVTAPHHTPHQPAHHLLAALDLFVCLAVHNDRRLSAMWVLSLGGQCHCGRGGHVYKSQTIPHKSACWCCGCLCLCLCNRWMLMKMCLVGAAASRSNLTAAAPARHIFISIQCLSTTSCWQCLRGCHPCM